MPVCFFEWSNPEEELRLVTRELGRQVSQKVQPRRVTVLSPHVMEKSAFAGKDKLGEWALCDVSRGQKAKVSSNSVSFCTIRSFKGLEADVVFLTGVKSGSRVCTVNDLYVGCSRARFLLYIFHETGYR